MIFRGDPAAEAGRRSHERHVADTQPPPPERLSSAELRDLCLAHGADDVGFVEADRPALGPPQHAAAQRLLPGARTLIALVGALHRDTIASPPRSVANAGFHHDGERLRDTTGDIARALATRGVKAVVTTVGFPMEVGRIATEPIWEIAHKVVAVEAGLGHMGINRNVIHPRFGNFVLLDTLVIDTEVDAYDTPLDYNPCADCNLCVAVCPVGAISRKEPFDFFACMNHNYREFMFGFSNWADSLAAAGSSADYRTKFREDETISMWQSLSSGPHYKSAYCMAVCPAGDDVIGPYLQDRKAYVDTYVRPLKDQVEPVYVQSGTHAETVAARNPAKDVRYIDFAVGVAGVDNAIRGLQHMFDRRRGLVADGTTILCVVDEAHEIVLTVERGALRRVDSGEPTATARGPLTAWMAVLTHAAAGSPVVPDDLLVTGDAAAFDALLRSLR